MAGRATAPGRHVTWLQQHSATTARFVVGMPDENVAEPRDALITLGKGAVLHRRDSSHVKLMHPEKAGVHVCMYVSMRVCVRVRAAGAWVYTCVIVC